MATVTVLKRGASKKSINSVLEKLAQRLKPKGVNTYNYVGKIKLGKDALILQRILRNEWE